MVAYLFIVKVFSLKVVMQHINEMQKYVMVKYVAFPELARVNKYVFALKKMRCKN